VKVICVIASSWRSVNAGSPPALPEIAATVIRLVLLGAGAGLRQGEAFGLAASQIDDVAGMITVCQQVVVVNRHPVLASPKTSASVRDVPVPRFRQEAVAGM
jgi:integrase